jgi:hypothetical protein
MREGVAQLVHQWCADNLGAYLIEEEDPKEHADHPIEGHPDTQCTNIPATSRAGRAR